MPFTQGKQFPLHSWIDFFFNFFFVQTVCLALLVGAVSSVHAFSGKADFQPKGYVCNSSPFLEGAG